jgi:hypothetical protein
MTSSLTLALLDTCGGAQQCQHKTETTLDSGHNRVVLHAESNDPFLAATLDALAETLGPPMQGVLTVSCTDHDALLHPDHRPFVASDYTQMALKRPP